MYKRTADAVMALQARLGGLQQCPPGASVTDWKVTGVTHARKIGDVGLTMSF